MKLTREEREKYRKEYDNALVSGELKWNGNVKNKESFERAINYWLSKIDTILEERVEKIRGEIKKDILIDIAKIINERSYVGVLESNERRRGYDDAFTEFVTELAIYAKQYDINFSNFFTLIHEESNLTSLK